MRICECGKPIPAYPRIDGKVRNLRNRSHCLECQPFNTKWSDLTKDQPYRGTKKDGKVIVYKDFPETAKNETRARIFWLAYNRKAKLVHENGGCCQKCGYNKSYRALSFHHRNPAEKYIKLSYGELTRYSWEVLSTESKKCDLLCSNCHMEVEDEIMKKDSQVDINENIIKSNKLDRVCSCGNPIPRRININGKSHNINNRIHCLQCCPFGKRKRNPSKPYSSTRDENGKKLPYHMWGEVAKQTMSKRTFLRRKRTRQEIIAAIGGCCEICSYNKSERALNFHHRDPSDKCASLSSRGMNKRMSVLKAEVRKCDLVCANCHMEIEERKSNAAERYAHYYGKYKDII